MAHKRCECDFQVCLNAKTCLKMCAKERPVLCEQPNGPFFFNGVFHLFSQCRKMAAVMPIPPGGWCHYASRDLVKWRRLGYPLQPDQWYDNVSLDTG